MKTDLARYNNEWYKQKISASTFKQVAWFFVNSLLFASSWFPVSSLKIKILKLFGATIGKGVIIKPSVSIKYPWKLYIGDFSWIGERVWIDNLEMVTIGNHVCISQGAFLLTGNHDFSKVSFDLIVKPIVLEDGVWVGAQALVCPGVICGSHSVLTTRSVATKNLEPYKIYQGYPATVVKQRVINS